MIDKSKWPFTDPDMQMNELGHEMYWTRVVDSEGRWIGILEWHECEAAQNDSDAGVSAGGVNFDSAPDFVKGARWQVQSEDPLTIHPSILCKTCGLHGFIQQGRWVPA